MHSLVAVPPAATLRRTDKLLPTSPSPLSPAQYFHVPDVIPELSTEQVLTSEWVPGVHIDKVRALAGFCGDGGVKAQLDAHAACGMVLARLRRTPAAEPSKFGALCHPPPRWRT